MREDMADCSPELKPTVRTEYQLLTPATHLTAPCWSTFKKYVEGFIESSGAQWKAHRREAADHESNPTKVSIRPTENHA